MKKHISFIIILAMLLALLPGTALAWDLDKNDYTIGTAAELQAFAAAVNGGNTFEGKTVTLTAHIDLLGADWTPIGTNTHPFKGEFDGQGHTIANLSSIGYSTRSAAGLFVYIENATIKNIILDGAYMWTNAGNVGCIAATASGTCTFENITVSHSIIMGHSYPTGGIVGSVEGNGVATFNTITVDSSTAVASLWGDPDTPTGGIAGSVEANKYVHLINVNVACRLDVHNDVVSHNHYYNYRNSGMLVGKTNTIVTDKGGSSVAGMGNITCTDCVVTFGDWANYTYVCTCHLDNTTYSHTEFGQDCKPQRIETGVDDNYNIYGILFKKNNINDNSDKAEYIRNNPDPGQAFIKEYPNAYVVTIPFEQLIGGKGALTLRGATIDDVIYEYEQKEEVSPSPDTDGVVYGSVGITVKYAANDTPAANTNKGSDISLWYNGGNSFGSSKSAVPTGVEIDGKAVSFTGDGSEFNVSCVPADAKWVTVRWNSTTVTTNFTPDANAACAAVAIPKTGDMPIWAAIAEFFSF